MNDTSSLDAARQALRHVVSDGQAPNGIQPADCGAWAETVQAIYDAHARGGTAEARTVAAALAKAHPPLARLLAGGEPADQGAAAPPRPACPDLPESAQRIYQHLAPCGGWLDDYVRFASEAAPMTPRSLHEAAGLFAVSMAVARRLYCGRSAGDLYPNLYFLFVSPSTIDHKSTGLRVLQSVIRDAGLSHLLMPRKATPAALVADLDYSKLPNARQLQEKDFYLARRAFAAQRGWIRDEASALFASLKQEFNAGLLELILDLYDCPPDYEELTISRSETKIERAYLSFFGASTPVEMAPHFANVNYWTNGLWARCLVVIPDDRPREFRFFAPAAGNNTAIIYGLQRIYRLFPTPIASLESIESEGGKSEQVVRLSELAPPDAVALAPGVWQAWEAYAEAMTHTLPLERAIDEELYASYGRLSDLAMKVAMLLAVMDADQMPVTVELRHFAAGQQRAEQWRAGLHRLWTSQSATNETRLMDRILRRLERAGSVGATVRDLCIGLRQTAKEVSEALTLLLKAGKVASEQTRSANGRSVEVWRCA